MSSSSASGRVPDAVIDEVRRHTDIVQIIGQFVELKRAGVNHKGLCPFHEEKTPSFNVHSGRQFFHCFGCQESGDVFAFLMKLEGRRFSEVLEDLARRAGVELPQERESPAEARAQAERRSERQRALDLNRKAVAVYRRLLAGEGGRGAREYLGQRGLGEAVTEAFELGYAPATAQAMVRLIQQEGIPVSVGETLGLVARRRQGPGHYDRFWERVIFPLHGAGGEVLGFGGRRLGEGDAPKYINTPETALYRKGEALYGLYQAAKGMRRRNLALIVEGNVDVLQMHQAGFDHTVAPMGTALTVSQARLLRRFAEGVVAVFDGDNAGRAAARRSVPILLEAGLETKIASLPAGEDPDSLIVKQGAEAMQAVLDGAVPAVDFVFTDLQGRMDPSIPGRARVLEQVAPLVAALPSPVARELYVDRLAMGLGIDRGTVARAVRGDPRPTGGSSTSRPAPAAGGATGTGTPAVREAAEVLDPAELDLLAVLVEHPHLVPRAEEHGASSLLTNEALRATYQSAVELQRGSGQVPAVELLHVAPARIRDALAGAVLAGKYASDGDPTRALDDCVLALQRRRLRLELQRIRFEMNQAQSKGDAVTVRALGLRLVQVEREIHETR